MQPCDYIRLKKKGVQPNKCVKKKKIKGTAGQVRRKIREQQGKCAGKIMVLRTLYSRSALKNNGPAA